MLRATSGNKPMRSALRRSCRRTALHRRRDRRAAGVSPLPGAQRYHSCTYKEYGNGARLDNGHLVLAKVGRVAVRWSRPIEGTIKTVTISREADGWYACFSCVAVPTRPVPRTGQETGIDVGLTAFLTTADGDAVEHRCDTGRASARSEGVAQVARRTKPSHRHDRRSTCAQDEQEVQRQRAGFPARGRAASVVAPWAALLLLLLDHRVPGLARMTLLPSDGAISRRSGGAKRHRCGATRYHSGSMLTSCFDLGV